jgi:hypothetical protein
VHPIRASRQNAGPRRVTSEKLFDLHRSTDTDRPKS